MCWLGLGPIRVQADAGNRRRVASGCNASPESVSRNGYLRRRNDRTQRVDLRRRHLARLVSNRETDGTVLSIATTLDRSESRRSWTAAPNSTRPADRTGWLDVRDSRDRDNRL